MVFLWLTHECPTCYIPAAGLVPVAPLPGTAHGGAGACCPVAAQQGGVPARVPLGAGGNHRKTMGK